MSHLFDKGFCVREPAWHGLAKVLPDYPGLDEGMKLAGHDHLIRERRLAILPEEGSPVPLINWKALEREDTGEVVSVMPSTYTIIQNRTPWELLDSLFQEGAKWDTAGILKGRYDEGNREVKGQVYWCLSLLDEPSMVKGDDSLIYPYIAATWSHDGSQAIRFRAMSVRIVCANTHHAAMFKAGSDLDISIRHTGDPQQRVEKAKKALKHARSKHKEFLVAADELIALGVNDTGLEAFIETIIPLPLVADGLIMTDRVRGNVMDARGKIRSILNGETGTVEQGIRNTAYGLFEAGIEYFDHARPHRTSETYFQRNVMRVERTKAALVGTVRKIAADFPN